MADKVPQLSSIGPGSLSQRFPDYIQGVPGQIMQGSLPGPGGFQQFQSFLGANPLGSTLLGGIGGLLSTGLNFLGQHMQNKWSENMWNKMNEYNTPDAQIKRFLDAGVNPAAAVASVTGTPNMTQQATPSGGPQATDMTAVGANAGQMASNMKLQGAQAEESQAAAALSGLQGEQLAQQTYELQRSWNTRLNKMITDGQLSKYEADKMRAFAPYQNTIAGLTAESMRQTYYNLQAEWYKIKAEANAANKAAEVSREQARSINVETDYRKWLTNKMIELGFAENDPMFSYVLAEHEGRKDDANAILNGIEKVNHAGAKGTSTGSDPVMDEIWAAYDAMNDNSVVDELKKNMDIAYNNWKEFFDTHHDNVNTEEANMYRDIYYAFRDSYESANNKNSKEYRKLKEARGIISPEKKLAYDAIGKVLDIGGDIASFYVGGKIMGKGLSSIKNANPVVVTPANNRQLLDDIYKNGFYQNSTMP